MSKTTGASDVFREGARTGHARRFEFLDSSISPIADLKQLITLIEFINLTRIENKAQAHFSRVIILPQGTIERAPWMGM